MSIEIIKNILQPIIYHTKSEPVFNAVFLFPFYSNPLYTPELTLYSEKPWKTGKMLKKGKRESQITSINFVW